MAAHDSFIEHRFEFDKLALGLRLVAGVGAQLVQQAHDINTIFHFRVIIGDAQQLPDQFIQPPGLGFNPLQLFGARLLQAEGDNGWLSTIAYGGGLVTAGLLLLLVSIQLATTVVQSDVDQVVGKVFAVFLWNWSYVLAPPMIALVLGTSLSIVRYRVAPRWTGWLGIVVTLTLLAPWLGFPIAVGWIGLVSIALIVQELRDRGAMTASVGP